MTRTRPAAAEQDADRRLGQHLLAVVRAQDAAIPAHRRAPRTVAEMRARLAQNGGTVVPAPQAQQPCGSCGGAGGKVVDTSSDGVSRQSWQTCGSCNGSGVR
ncbi:hypothetical protein [Streptomyces sp. NPDC006334]|uniref:hypothetical protein n=1 Tax=Streptomyces sp. NPDC006334 TaxID=3156754 RepID=UPI0033BD48B8